jgi:Protein of unknown function (DUF2442)
MKLTGDDIRRAEGRMRERIDAGPRATAARYDRRLNCIVVALSSGIELRIPVRLAQGLAGARASDLRQIEISPTGLGLHWPKLDADLYVPSLLVGLLGSRRWMARMLGQAGGRATSPAKRAAARANGRRGGRPRREQQSHSSDSD